MQPFLKMPCPRLELRWIKTGETWGHRECIYSLVIPVGEHDIRASDGVREISLEISRTQVTGRCGSKPIYDGKVGTPFRDHAHAIWDCTALGGHIPIVAICEDDATLIELTPVSSAVENSMK